MLLPYYYRAITALIKKKDKRKKWLVQSKTETRPGKNGSGSESPKI